MNYEVRAYPVNNESHVKSNISLIIDDAFMVNGLKLFEKSKGEDKGMLFLGMPTVKVIKDDKETYVKTAFPLSEYLRDELQIMAISAYQDALKRNAEKHLHKHEPPQKEEHVKEESNVKPKEVEKNKKNFLLKDFVNKLSKGNQEIDKSAER